MKLILNNYVDLCGIYENIIYHMKENTNPKWIKKIYTNTLEELFDENIETCINS